MQAIVKRKGLERGSKRGVGLERDAENSPPLSHLESHVEGLRAYSFARRSLAHLQTGQFREKIVRFAGYCRSKNETAALRKAHISYPLKSFFFINVKHSEFLSGWFSVR